MVTSNELVVLAGTAFSFYVDVVGIWLYNALLSKITSSPEKTNFSRAIAAMMETIVMIGTMA